MSTPTPEAPGAATLSPVERDEALLEIGTTLGFFASCIKSGDHWSPTCQDARDKAWAALARLRAPVAPAPIEPGEGMPTHEQWKVILDALKQAMLDYDLRFREWPLSNLSIDNPTARRVAQAILAALPKPASAPTFAETLAADMKAGTARFVKPAPTDTVPVSREWLVQETDILLSGKAADRVERAAEIDRLLEGARG